MAWAPQKATHRTFTFSAWILCECDSTTEYWFNQDVYGTDVTCFCTLIFRKWRDIIELKLHRNHCLTKRHISVRCVLAHSDVQYQGKEWREEILAWGCVQWSCGLRPGSGLPAPCPYKPDVTNTPCTFVSSDTSDSCHLRATTIDLRSWKSTSAQVCYNLFGNVCSELLPSVPLETVMWV